MSRFLSKCYWTLRSIRRIFCELVSDLLTYYVSPYPFLLIIGAFRRVRRRFKIIWIPRKRGRPELAFEVVELILDMKRCNPGWGSLTISHQLKILGIVASKTTVSLILRENGFIPPKTKFVPSSWESFLKAYSRSSSAGRSSR